MPIAGRFVGRLALRAIPWVGAALLGYEAYQIWKRFGGAWGPLLAGYTKTLDCGSGNRPNDRLSNQSSTVCGGTHPSTPPALILGNGPGGGGFPQLIGYWAFRPTDSKWINAERWNKIGSPRPWRLLPFGHPQPGVEPESNPNMDPEANPLGRPAPIWPAVPPGYAPYLPEESPHSPEPVRGPKEAPKPVSEPEYDVPPEWPDWSPYPFSKPRPVVRPGQRPNPRPNPRPDPGPSPSPRPSPRPGPQPQPNIPPAISFGPRGRPRKVPPRNKPGKPDKRTKERKFQWSVKGSSLIGIALNLATESADLIDAFWWALPRNLRTGPIWVGDRWVAPPPQQKLRDIWDNFDSVDGEKALDNFIANQVGDFLGGKVGKTTAKATQKAWKQGLISQGFTFGRGPAI